MRYRIFKIKSDERKWPAHLSDLLGEELAGTCSFEVDATAKEHWARVIIFNFNNSKSLLNNLNKNENVISAYLIDDKMITKYIKNNN